MGVKITQPTDGPSTMHLQRGNHSESWHMPHRLDGIETKGDIGASATLHMVDLVN